MPRSIKAVHQSNVYRRVEINVRGAAAIRDDRRRRRDINDAGISRAYRRADEEIMAAGSMRGGDANEDGLAQPASQ